MAWPEEGAEASGLWAVSQYPEGGVAGVDWLSAAYFPLAFSPPQEFVLGIIYKS
jgi:hypothetical protein